MTDLDEITPINTAANLQSGFSVKTAAKLMNVSERAVYMARELLAVDRPDLHHEVSARNMSILGALKIAKPEKYGKKPNALGALLRAWEAATPDERDKFLRKVSP